MRPIPSLRFDRQGEAETVVVVAVVRRNAAAGGEAAVGPVERRVAPRVLCALSTATRRLLPLGFGRETEAQPEDAAEPIAVGDGVEPAHADDGLAWMVERGIIPEARRLVTGGGEEVGVLAVRYGNHGHVERRQRYAMRRAFIRAAVVVAQRERACRNENGLCPAD